MSATILTTLLIGTFSAARADVKSAGAAGLISEDVRAYARARWRVRSGSFEQALRELESLETKLIGDRVALVRGQALEGSRDLAGAEQAYRRALDSSHDASVSEAAARGLVSVYGKLGDARSLIGALDLLLETPTEPDPALELLRITTLVKLGRTEEARRHAGELLDRHPDPRTAASAERLLAQLSTNRRLTKEDRIRAELSRARYFARSRRFGRAVQALSRVKSWAPKLAISVDLELADLHRENRARDRADAILLRLGRRRDLGDAGGEVLLRQGRIAVDRHQYRRARKIYAELAARFPGTPAASSGAYEAGQLEYDAGAHAAAAEKMFALAIAEPASALAPRALWMAGWSAYLAGTSSVAVAAFERLLESDVEPERAEGAMYWLARTHERAHRRELARVLYRELALRAPLRYYGLWARSRLDGLGEPARAPVERPERFGPDTVEELVALLGPDRPLNVDRAVALFEADLRAEAVVELLAVVEHYRAGADKRGTALVIELFQMFDRDAWASLLARHIAEDIDLQPDGGPHLWRLWTYAYPTPFRAEVEKAAKDHDVDPFLAYAVMRTESRFRPDAVSPVGACGLMQLMPATARWIGRVTPRARPQVGRYRAPGPNIWLGAWYVRNLVDRYGGNLVAALGAYNAGPNAMDRWTKRYGALEMDELAERTPYDETRNYIRRTLESFLIYHELYDRPVRLRSC